MRVLCESWATLFGFGLLGPEWSYERYREGVHGNDERVDVESIELTMAAPRRIVVDRIEPDCERTGIGPERPDADPRQRRRMPIAS